LKLPQIGKSFRERHLRYRYFRFQRLQQVIYFPFETVRDTQLYNPVFSVNGAEGCQTFIRLKDKVQVCDIAAGNLKTTFSQTMNTRQMMLRQQISPLPEGEG
jgi:hypothetical protein